MNHLSWFSCLALAVSVTGSVVLLPKPSGPYNTTISTAKLVDHERIDPFAPTKQPRAVMISIFHPVEPRRCIYSSTLDYMPPATATFHDQLYGQYGIPNGTFESLKIQACRQEIFAYKRSSEYPIVVFSPGGGNSRLQYSAIAQSVASSGFIVITIDHPYDAGIVEFPDGSYVLAGNISTEAQIELSVHTRAQDTSFVLNQLSKPSITQTIIPGACNGFNVNKVGMFGHSLGGAASAEAMLNDTRIASGLNLDGTFFGPAIQKGLDRPFLIFGHQDKNRTTDPSWAAIWPHLRGWKLELELKKSAHGTFTDLALLIKVLGLSDALPEEVQSLLGALDGQRAVEIIQAYVAAFFDFVLRKKNSGILVKANASYPEVAFVG